MKPGALSIRPSPAVLLSSSEDLNTARQRIPEVHSLRSRLSVPCVSTADGYSSVTAGVMMTPAVSIISAKHHLEGDVNPGIDAGNHPPASSSGCDPSARVIMRSQPTSHQPGEAPRWSNWVEHGREDGAFLSFLPLSRATEGTKRIAQASRTTRRDSIQAFAQHAKEGHIVLVKNGLSGISTVPGMVHRTRLIRTFSSGMTAHDGKSSLGVCSKITADSSHQKRPPSPFSALEFDELFQGVKSMVSPLGSRN
jgi:hypothetical protein